MALRGPGGSRPPCELTGTPRSRRTGISCRPSSTLTLPTGRAGRPRRDLRAAGDLHPQLQLDQSTIRINKPATMNATWPERASCSSRACSPRRTSCSTRGASGRRPSCMAPVASARCGRRKGHPAVQRGSAQRADGRGRAAILRRVELPRTTTELARALGLSGATVSVHLSTLKRCGMVTSWRSGRRVLYQRTPLAFSVLSAVSHPSPPDDASLAPPGDS